MPSKTPKQAKFMRAIAHGWTPSRMQSPPSRAVAQEFVDADRKYSGGFAENRYWTGGLAAMDEAHAGYKRGSLDFKWQEGGDVDYEENGMRRGGRTRRNGGGAGGLGGLGATESPYTYEEQVKRDAFMNLDIKPRGVWSTAMYNLQQKNLPPPEPTIAATAGTSVTGPSGSDVTVYSGPRLAGPRGGRRGGGRRGGGRRNGGGGGRPPGGGPGGPGAAPPRIIPTTPASYVGAAAGAPGGESPYRDQLRAHQAKIAATLGSARGGHVNYYDEGGPVRSGHPEDTGERGVNPWDPEADPAAYKYWESRYHQEPPTPEEMVEAGEEIPEPGFLERWFGVKPEPANIAKIEAGIAEGEGQAYGGRVGYQAGGQVMTPPVGGVPPWIEPAGGMEPERYQFGGGVSPAIGAAMRQYRGVPPQRGGVQRGAPAGGGSQRGFMGMMNRARSQAAAGQAPPGYSRYLQMNRGPGRSTRMNIPPGGTPQGALAQMYGRAQQQQAGAQPEGGMWRRMFEQAQQQQAGGAQPGGGILARIRQAQAERAGGPGGGGGVGLDPYSEGELRRRGPRGPMAPGGGGGPLQLPPGGWLSGPNVIEENPIMNPETGERLYGGEVGINPPPSGPFVPPRGRRVTGGSGQIGDPYQYGRASGAKPRPAPGTFPEGGGFQGGPRVPPNMRGYIQRQRMMNRPPANVGGAQQQRVGMQDQQGALARAMQKGAGRAPMSRRMGFGRAGPTR